MAEHTENDAALAEDVEAALTETIARIEGIGPRETFRANERRAYWRGVADALVVVRGQRDALRTSRDQPVTTEGGAS